MGLTPDGLGHFHDHAKLALLILFRDPIADDRAGKTALGAEGQPIQGEIATRLPNARCQLFLGLLAPGFGRDESQDNDLILRHFPQRLEGARAGIIVFEQQPLSLDSLEDALGNWLVPTRGQPPAALVTSSQVETERDFGKITDHGVVHCDTLFQPSIKTPSL